MVRACKALSRLPPQRLLSPRLSHHPGLKLRILGRDFQHQQLQPRAQQCSRVSQESSQQRWLLLPGPALPLAPGLSSCPALPLRCSGPGR